jgi:hypothetical protein
LADSRANTIDIDWKRPVLHASSANPATTNPAPANPAAAAQQQQQQQLAAVKIRPTWLLSGIFGGLHGATLAGAKQCFA